MKSESSIKLMFDLFSLWIVKDVQVKESFRCADDSDCGRTQATCADCVRRGHETLGHGHGRTQDSHSAGAHRHEDESERFGGEDVCSGVRDSYV